MKTNHSRIRGRKLQEIRKRHFENYPLCVMCEKEGRITLATELDHIIALHNGGTNDDSNYQGLCSSHHKEKTIKDLNYKPKQVIGLDGYPIK